MRSNKTLLSSAIAFSFFSAPAHAFDLSLYSETVDMQFNGLYTLLDQDGLPLQNSTFPYYYDPTWGYGIRTQISGTLSINKSTGAGTATVNPFDFFGGGPYEIGDFELQTIEGGLLLGNMDISWLGTVSTAQIVLDASGLFSDWASNGFPLAGEVYDSTYCTNSSTCTTPASNDISKFRYPIGPVPVSTSAFNVTGNTGVGTTLGQIGIGTDDGIGGSPMDNGPFSGFSVNLDFTSLTVTTVPVPASVWLFGTGLISLLGITRKRRVIS